jgi:hypothetical protein
LLHFGAEIYAKTLFAQYKDNPFSKYEQQNHVRGNIFFEKPSSTPSMKAEPFRKSF